MNSSNHEALARMGRPPHAQALADANDHLRRATAALRACHLQRAGDAAELAAVYGVLRDQLLSLEQLARRA